VGLVEGACGGGVWGGKEYLITSSRRLAPFSWPSLSERLIQVQDSDLDCERTAEGLPSESCYSLSLSVPDYVQLSMPRPLLALFLFLVRRDSVVDESSQIEHPARHSPHPGC
jgi:hypothetical protein